MSYSDGDVQCKILKKISSLVEKAIVIRKMEDFQSGSHFMGDPWQRYNIARTPNLCKWRLNGKVVISRDRPFLHRIGKSKIETKFLHELLLSVAFSRSHAYVH